MAIISAQVQHVYGKIAKHDTTFAKIQWHHKVAMSMEWDHEYVVVPKLKVAHR